MTRLLLIAALLAGVTGCVPASPCASLAAPTPLERALVADGAEVERKVGDVECDLGADGVWRRDT